MKTMRQIIQAAAGEMALPLPSVVAGNTETDAIQFLALLNRLSDDLLRDYEWEALTTAYRFNTQFLAATGTTTANSAVVTGLSSTTGLDSTYQVLGTGINNDVYVVSVDSPTQVTMSEPANVSGAVALTFCKVKYTMPADYGNMVPNTHWDKTQHWQMIGPMTAQQWEFLKNGFIATGPRVRWRRLGGYFQIWPAFSNAENLGMEYISNSPVRDLNGVPKESFTADTDTCIYPDGLMIVGLKHKYYEAKGLGDQYKAAYESLLALSYANDAGTTVLQMAPRLDSTLIGWENIPDSGFGG